MNKCSKCKKTKSIELFKMKKNGDYLKFCNQCREKDKASKQRNKCIHKRQRYQCIDCCGSCICIHKQRRSQCIECDGSNVCQHKKRKDRCKQCSNPVQITIKR